MRVPHGDLRTMNARNSRAHPDSRVRLRRIRTLLAHYGPIADASGNPELVALVHDLDDALATPTSSGICDRQRLTT